MKGAPLILPTPCGYHFATGLQVCLKDRYLQEDLWVPGVLRRFGDSDGVVELKRHIRHQDIYIVADVQSHLTTLPVWPDGQRQGYRITMNADGYRVEGKGGGQLDAMPRKQGIDVNFADLCRTLEVARNAVKQGRITIILPFFPSSRQDRRDGRQSLDLRVKVKQLETLGADHVLTLDIHTPSTELAFDIRTGFDQLTATSSLITHLRADERTWLKDAYLVAPDEGAVERNVTYAERLGCPMGFLYKHRRRTEENVVDGIYGFAGSLEDLQGKHILIADDMIDTGATLVNAARFLKRNGAASITAVAAHAVFSHPALELFSKAVADGLLRKVIVTNSITLPAKVTKMPWLSVVDIIPLFAEAVHRLNTEASMQGLLEE